MRKLPPPPASETLRVHAVARLMLDNVAHVKAFWIATGIEVAQAALWFGVDDLDGTVQEEKIYHMAGARTPEMMTTREIQAVIRAAGREPVERDTLYNVINEEPVRSIEAEASTSTRRMEPRVFRPGMDQSPPSSSACSTSPACRTVGEVAHVADEGRVVAEADVLDRRAAGPDRLDPVAHVRPRRLLVIRRRVLDDRRARRVERRELVVRFISS